MAAFTTFRKFDTAQQRLYARVKSTMLRLYPREVRKLRQLDAAGPPSGEFNFGSARGRFQFFTQPSRRLAAGGYGVIVDDAFLRDMAKLAASAEPIAAQAMDEIVGKWAFKVWREWPWDTGVSRSLLDLRVGLLGESGLIAEFLSRAPYTTFIKAKKLGGDRPDQRLIQKPAPRVAHRMGMQILERLTNGS